MNKKMAREIVESLPSLYPSMTADEEEAIWTVLATNSNTENDGDCISRQAAIDEIRKCRFLVDAIEKIISLPPAQPEIIRCKDCKHLFNKDDEGGKCWHFNGFSKVVSYDDFCSRAERRTDE